MSQGSCIEHEVLLAAKSQLRPIFAALAADLAKPARRRTGEPKLRKAPAERTPPATPSATIVELKPRQPNPKLAQENAGIGSSFRLTLNDKMRERGDTTLDLHRLLDKAGEQVEPSTLRSWLAGRKAPATADSFRVLGLIEAHYELPAGCLKGGLPHRGRALKGHALASISASERRRLAWHLPDDFGERSAPEQEAILEWVRTRVTTGATDYRRYQAAAIKHRYAVKFLERRLPPCRRGRREMRVKQARRRRRTADITKLQGFGRGWRAQDNPQQTLRPARATRRPPSRTHVEAYA